MTTTNGLITQIVWAKG